MNPRRSISGHRDATAVGRHPIVQSAAGAVIPLVNWSGKPIKDLKVTLKARLPGRPRSLASGNRLQVESANNAAAQCAFIPTLTAAAMSTERIRLGTFVASPNYRHPVPFAKDVATLDQVAGGRVVLGLGSGGTGFDAYVLGRPMPFSSSALTSVASV